MQDVEIDAFVRWFQENGGYLDTKAMGITEFPDSGRGGIALCDIPEGRTLFTIPRKVTLSTRTSPLPVLFGLDAWRTHGLHKSWVGLILCMMWEDAWARESGMMHGGSGGQGQGTVQTKWGPYMRTLPTIFDTPMFWNSEELEELRGTAVIGKIGREDAERAYIEQLVPAINTSPVLFPPSHLKKWYTLEAYHCAGSRILSRSFTVIRWTKVDRDDEAEVVIEEGKRRADEIAKGGADGKEAEDLYSDASVESSMHVGDVHPHFLLWEDANEGQDSGSENEDEDDPSDVAMVPMADILNARWRCENAKLFYEPLVLRMMTTKCIEKGEQIFNTYGDLPNSDLLRQYGLVDSVQLPRSSSAAICDRDGDVEMEGDTNAETVLHLGNPSDVVEVRADLAVDVVQTIYSESNTRDLSVRIEWWLDEGEDDTFVLCLADSSSDFPAAVPPEFISFVRLLILSDHDFTIARSNGKLPKGKLKKVDDRETNQVLGILDEVLNRREGMYIGSIEDDERLLSIPETLSKRKRHAVIVRLGEKRILRNVRQTVSAMLAELEAIGGAGDKQERRCEGSQGGRPTRQKSSGKC